MNYSELTDFQINKLVAERLGFDSPSIQGASTCQRILIHAKGMPTRQEKIVDYCNNPSDAWPIILENKISIQHNVLTKGGDWFAGVYCFDGEPIETDYMNNPLRAAMIVYLMMMSDNKGN